MCAWTATAATTKGLSSGSRALSLRARLALLTLKLERGRAFGSSPVLHPGLLPPGGTPLVGERAGAHAPSDTEGKKKEAGST